ncbi:hypothetical protein, partial [Escherichia coli]|uniref:hypothetical protein n=1 Tax=Escherichia coli TaxID=562 RepID=UPI001BDCB3D9
PHSAGATANVDRGGSMMVVVVVVVVVVLTFINASTSNRIPRHRWGHVPISLARNPAEERMGRFKDRESEGA